MSNTSFSKKTQSAPNLAAGLLASVKGRHIAQVRATEPGIIAGLDLLSSPVDQPVGTWSVKVNDGDCVDDGTVILEVAGTASEIGVAEDYVMGPLGFASGIASRAEELLHACPAGLSIACGGWKKLPFSLKPLLRHALATVGVLPRLVSGDFIYVNKNAVRLLGSVEAAITAGRNQNHGPVAIQVCNCEEAEFAARHGAGVIMVDTGCLQDLANVHRELTKLGLREQVTLAFGGGVRKDQLEPAFDAGAQTVDVGRAILDAPLLDLRLVVI